MKAAVVVLLCALALAMIVIYALLAAASEADERAEEMAMELEKERQKREPMIVKMEGYCEMYEYRPDGTIKVEIFPEIKNGGNNEHQD